MSKLRTRLVALFGFALLLSACAQEETPQDVTQAFWDAVVINDAKGAVKHSTLADAAQYDAFGRDWQGLTPSLGKIVIEGDRASVVTMLAGPDESSRSQVETYLLRTDGEWKVDYARTGTQLGGGPLGALFGHLENIGSSITEQLKAASDDFAVSMERMGQQLEEAANQVSEQASADIAKYGEHLRKSIDELAQSAQQALTEERKRLSADEQRVLEDVVASLSEGSEQLAQQTLQSIADGARALAAARQQLDAIDNEALQPYREQWRAWGERIEAETEKMLDDVLPEERPDSAEGDWV